MKEASTGKKEPGFVIFTRFLPYIGTFRKKFPPLYGFFDFYLVKSCIFDPIRKVDFLIVKRFFGTVFCWDTVFGVEKNDSEHFLDGFTSKIYEFEKHVTVPNYA